jgi:hypothetical protein
MAGEILHRFVSTVEDAGSETEVGPDEWNDSLTVDGGSDGDAMVRRTAEDDGWRLEKRGSPLSLVNVTQAASVGAGETNLHSHVIPAAHLEVDKKLLILKGTGHFAANADPKTLEFKFGAAADIVLNNVTANPNDLAWSYEIEVYRTGSDAQRVVIKCWVGLDLERHSQHTFTEDDGAAITCQVKGTGTSNDDILQNVSQSDYKN